MLLHTEPEGRTSWNHQITGFTSPSTRSPKPIRTPGAQQQQSQVKVFKHPPTLTLLCTLTFTLHYANVSVARGEEGIDGLIYRLRYKTAA